MLVGYHKGARAKEKIFPEGVRGLKARPATISVHKTTKKMARRERRRQDMGSSPVPFKHYPPWGGFRKVENRRTKRGGRKAEKQLGWGTQLVDQVEIYIPRLFSTEGVLGAQKSLGEAREG